MSAADDAQAVDRVCTVRSVRVRGDRSTLAGSAHQHGTGSATTAAEPKTWPRKPSSERFEDCRNGAVRLLSPHGCLPSPPTRTRTEVRRIPPRTITLDAIAEPADPRDIESGTRPRAATARSTCAPDASGQISRRARALLFSWHGCRDGGAEPALPEGTLKARLARTRYATEEAFSMERDDLDRVHDRR